MNVWASNYQVYYRPVGAISWLKKNTTSNIVQLKSLSPGITYQYKIRTKCENLIFSEFSDILNFTTLPLRESNMNERSFIDIYPNPASEEISISLSEDFNNAIIFITNITGNVLLQQNMLTQFMAVNIASIPSGLYFINFNIDGIKSTQKFIKQ